MRWLDKLLLLIHGDWDRNYWLTDIGPVPLDDDLDDPEDDDMDRAIASDYPA